MASFGAPNRTGVMNSLPPEHRGAGSGMNTTFQNSAQVISIGIFFSLMIVGLSAALPHNVSAGLLAHGVPAPVADRASHLPPISTLFAAFLGYNPVQHLVGAETIAHLSASPAGGTGPARLLPRPDRRSLPEGSPRRLRLRHRDEPGRGRRLVDPGQALRVHAGRRRARGRAGADPGRRPRRVNAAGPRRRPPAAGRGPGQADPAGRVDAPRGRPPGASTASTSR